MSFDRLVFGECAKLVRASTNPHDNPNAPYVGLEHIGQGSLHLVGHGYARDVDSQKTKFEPSDILFGKLRPYFRKLIIAPFSGMCSTDIWVIRPRGKGNIDRNFLFYWMASEAFVSHATETSEGTRMPRAKWDVVSKLEIPYFSPSEQKAIGTLLRSLDDRIDHNRALASNLEAIARRLFKSWFIDFDPVRAKAAGEMPSGLADDIAALFPDRFVDSELVEIPEGWRVETLASVARLNPEAWTTRKHPDEIHYLDLSNVKDGLIEAPTKYSWEEAPSRARRVLQQGDTIIGTVRPGNRSFALIDQAGLTGSTGFAVLRPASDMEREYLYLASTNDDATERLAHLADGAAYPAVRPEVVLATEVIIPSDEVMAAFSDVTKGMIDRASVCKQEANALAGIRDLLIPRLISGKLRVGDAESTIEEAIA